MYLYQNTDPKTVPEKGVRHYQTWVTGEGTHWYADAWFTKDTEYEGYVPMVSPDDNYYVLSQKDFFFLFPSARKVADHFL